VSLRFSGIENQNFYGFGNQTRTSGEDPAHDRDERVHGLPALRYQPSKAFELHVGAEAKWCRRRGDSLVEQEEVYGSGKFGEVGVRAGLEYDSRGAASA